MHMLQLPSEVQSIYLTLCGGFLYTMTVLSTPQIVPQMVCWDLDKTVSLNKTSYRVVTYP